MKLLLAAVGFLILTLAADLVEQSKHLKYHLLRQDHTHEPGKL
jgi:hypothetical protein